MNNMKVCTTCNKLLDLDNFYKWKNECKKCYYKSRKQYLKEYCIKHKDRLNEYRQTYRQTEKCKKYFREYYQNNKEYLKGYFKKYQQTEQYKIYHKKYNAEHYPHTKPITKTCILCAKEFETKQYHQIYCSKKCKQCFNAKKSDARKRQKGFFALMGNPFPNQIVVEYHHIHSVLPFTVPIPRNIHQTYMNGNINYHIKRNNDWIENILGFNVTGFLNVSRS